jgi:hypothetical protein
VRAFQRTVVSLVALAVAVLPFLASGPASAAPAGAGVVAAAPCLSDLARLTGHRETPHWRQHSDTPHVTQRDLDALPPEQTRRSYVTREVTPKLAARVTMPVYVHVLKGTHKGERNPFGPRRARNLISILNKGMAGDQSKLSVATRYRFSIKKIDYTKRDGWYHAYFNGPRDTRMKRKLHRGNARTLNLYINGGGPRNAAEPLLGWSRFPWQYAGTPRLDGISVNVAALPGGSARGYNRGDTVIHETGHWLGLFHTFEGGCDGDGDRVSDTAAEADPSFECETTRDTCPALGLDPVRNFMDYSLDTCMNMFTDGQVRRMDSAFQNWRQ